MPKNAEFQLLKKQALKSNTIQHSLQNKSSLYFFILKGMLTWIS